MTTNGYPKPTGNWGGGNNDPTMQFDRVNTSNDFSYPDPYQAEPPYGRKQRNPMLIALIVITVLVFIVLISAAIFAYQTMKEPPISGGTDTSQAQSTTQEEKPTATTSAPRTSKTTASTTTSKSSTTTPGAPPGSRPTEANLPPGVEPVNSAARNGAEAGYLVNLYKSGNTSDEFANAVHQAYLAQYSKPPARAHTVTAESPVTGKTYEMTCTDEGSFVHCTGGVGAHVYMA